MKLDYLVRLVSNTLLATTIALSAVAPARADIDGTAGRYFFRYKTLSFSDVKVPEVTKDITAYYVGGVGFEFSEKLPMKSDWAEDSWRIVSGKLPSGLSFDAATLTFSGTPSTEVKGEEVILEGIDSNGKSVATASATFDVYAITGVPVHLSLYAHTGNYKVDELPMPAGITVDHWERVFSPPKGMTVDDVYFQGTPEAAGTYPVMIFAKNYMDETVATFYGNYLVEDGPTFAHIPDDVRDLPAIVPFQHFKFGAPTTYKIDHLINPAKPARYILEIAPSDKLPPGVAVVKADPKDLRFEGSVGQPYKTAKVRFKAVDSDNTVGFSNWFTFGTADPTLYCGTITPVWLFTNTAVHLQVPTPNNTYGSTVAYSLDSGTLPDGLDFDAAVGLITGTPKVAGANSTASFKVDASVEGNTVSGYCSFRFNVGSSGLSVVDATPVQDRHLRVGSTYNGTISVVGGIPEYTVSVDRTSGLSFTSENNDTPSVSVSGTVAGAGIKQVPVSLANGDGTSAGGFLDIYGYDPLSIGVMPDITIKRLAGAQVWGRIPYAADTVIPDISGAVDYPLLTLDKQGELPSGIALEGDSITGATKVEAGTYGPFVPSIADYENKPVSSAPFNVTVLPRDEIAVASLTPPEFTVEWDESKTVTPVTLKQPEGARDFKVTWSVDGDLPSWLHFDHDNGAFVADRGIPFADLGTHGPFTVTATDEEGSTVTTDPFDVSVSDWPAPAASVTTIYKGTVSGDTSADETATWINIFDLKKFISGTTVIGGVSGVTLVSADPSSPAGLTFDAASGSITGRPTSEFSGDVSVAFKDAKGREGTMLVPLSVKPYPVVAMENSEYDIPRLASAAYLTTPVRGIAKEGFWNRPAWSLDDAAGMPQLPAGLSVDAYSGTVTGRSQAPEGTTVSGLRLKAVSTGANGEQLVSYTGRFDLHIKAPAPITLSYDLTQAKYLMENVDGGGYRLSSKTSPIATLGGSFVPPPVYSMDKDQAVADGMPASDYNVNADNGNIVGEPTKLGKWDVTVNVKDADGRSPASPVAMSIWATLAGDLQRSNGGSEKTLRVEEPFKTEVIDVSNNVGTVTFSTVPAILPSGMDFSPITGAFSDQSVISTPSDTISVSVQATDRDGRTFGTSTPSYSFSVMAPLELEVDETVKHITAVQYSPDAGGSINVAFGPTVKNRIGAIRYSLSGDVPGTLVNAYYDAQGAFSNYVWTDSDGNQQETAVGDPKAAEKLPLDGLVFDTKAGTLKGIPSKAGLFEGISISANDTHADGYIRNVPTRKAYNSATVTGIAIDVAPAEALSVSNSADSETLAQYTSSASLVTTVSHAAYGRQPTWTAVSGSRPAGVTAHASGDRFIYSGYPTVMGTFDNIVWKVKDAAGREITTRPVAFTVEERKAFELVTDTNPVGLVVDKTEVDVVVSAVNAAFNAQIEDGEWTIENEAGLPPGLELTIKDGRVRIKGSSDTVGKYNGIRISATDRLGAPASITLDFAVLAEDDLIAVATLPVKAKRGFEFETDVTATNTYGKVTYTTTATGVAVDDMGHVKGTLFFPGKTDVSVSAGDTTGRTTAAPVKVEVLDYLKLTPSTSVYYLERGKTASGALTTENVMGTVSYEKGDGNWPAGLGVDPATGSLTGTVTADIGTYAELTIRATDSFGSAFKDTQASTPFSVQVDAADPAKPFALVSTANPAGFIANRSDTPATVVTAINTGFGLPVAAASWTVTNQDKLPPGLTATISDGEVRFDGTPTQIGNFQGVHIEATDKLNKKAFLDLPFTVLPPDSAIELTVQNITTKVGVPVSMQASSTNTYGTVRYYSNDIAHDLRGQLSLSGGTGLITGAFDSVGNLDFDVFVTDSTNRVTSKPVAVSVIPNLRVAVPAQVSAEQGKPLSRSVSTTYALGTVKYSKGAGVWPDGIIVDPDSGTISSSYTDPLSGATTTEVLAATGTYSGLTIKATDTFGTPPKVDPAESDAFLIKVDPIDASPVIEDVTGKWVFATVGTVSAPWKPAVTDSVQHKAWSYAGTKYTLNHDLKQDTGLDFNTDTGMISGTPTKPVIYKDLTITVTSARGDADTTNPIWFGVKPAGDITATANQKTTYAMRGDQTSTTNAPLFDNTYGTLAFSTTQQGTVVAVNTSTGVVTKAPFNSSAIAGQPTDGWPIDLQVTDEFDRKGTLRIYAKLYLGITITAKTSVYMTPLVANDDLNPPTVANVYGTKSFSSDNLPSWMTLNPTTGAISGTPPANALGLALPITVTVTDSLDAATKSVTYTLKTPSSLANFRLIVDTWVPHPTLPNCVVFAEMKVLSGANDITSASAVTPSASDAGYPAANLTDNKNSTLWITTTTGAKYITMTPPAGKPISSMRLEFRKDNATACNALTWRVQTSPDKVTWTDAWNDAFTAPVNGGYTTKPNN
jgi:hypothetical protein